MKKILYFLPLIALAIFAGCEDELPLYNDQQDRLIFLYDSEDGRSMIDIAESTYAVNYSFVSNDLEEDVVYVRVKAIGFVRDYARSVEFEQVATEGDDAQPGVHYVAFTDPFYAEHLVIPAGQTVASLPVKVSRDPSLKDKTVNLRLRVKDNGTFVPGYERRAEVLVTITDALTKPSNWIQNVIWDFGKYGKVKHQFMTKALGQTVDEDYLSELGYIEQKPYLNDNYDSSFIAYLVGVLKAALAEENERRASQNPPLGPLTEEDGVTLVSFP